MAEKKSQLVVFLFVFLLICSLPLTATAKETPIPGLMDMFTNFNMLEEQFRSDKWDEADTTVKKIDDDYRLLVPDLKGKVEAKQIQKFGFLIKSLKKSIEGRNAETLEKPYMNLQSLFLDLMENFAYTTPPSLIIADLYIEEAMEALEDKHYSFVSEEMEELEDLKSRITETLTAQGAAPAVSQDFFELAETMEGLISQKNYEEIENNLKKMKELLKPYIKE